MRLVTFVALLCGLVHVKGGISELDIFNDVQPLRIGAFNIQIFGETTFMKSEVRHELIIMFEFIFEPGQTKTPFKLSILYLFFET